MKYFYDQENDALSLSLVDRTIVESEEVWPGVVVDFDAKGLPVGLDIDSRASEIADVRGLTAGREIRIAGPEVTGSPAVSDGADLRLRRESLGLTQAELAAALGTTANTIARWERGELRIENPRMLGLAITQLSAPARRPGGDAPSHYAESQPKAQDAIRETRRVAGSSRKARTPRRAPAKKK